MKITSSVIPNVQNLANYYGIKSDKKAYQESENKININLVNNFEYNNNLVNFKKKPNKPVKKISKMVSDWVKTYRANERSLSEYQKYVDSVQIETPELYEKLKNLIPQITKTTYSLSHCKDPVERELFEQTIVLTSSSDKSQMLGTFTVVYKKNGTLHETIANMHF